MKNFVINVFEGILTLSFWIILVAWVAIGGLLDLQAGGPFFIGALIGALVGLVTAVSTTGALYLLISINDSQQKIRSELAGQRAATEPKISDGARKPNVLRKSWDVLEKYDDDIKKGIRDLMELGPSAVKQFKIAYEEIDDRRQIPHRIDTIKTDIQNSDKHVTAGDSKTVQGVTYGDIESLAEKMNVLIQDEGNRYWIRCYGQI